MSGNGQGQVPTPVIELRFPEPPPVEVFAPPPKPRFRLAAVLFVLTIFSTLAVGTEYAMAYSQNRAPFSGDLGYFADIVRQPSLLLLGIPFSFTLVGILLAHELGHYFACRYYGISASYPYFLPFPTIIGTMGAFIRIRSPIVNRKALFDVGLAGPVVGFLFTLPALAFAVAYSKVVPAAQLHPLITFGNPPLVHLLAAIFRPEVPVQDILLHPVGRAAWVGLFATALNLLPIGQLDGGHILFSLAGRWHRRLSLFFSLLLIPLGKFFWEGWYIWAVLPLLLGMRHPQLLDPYEAIDQKRRVWALVAVVIFLLCFTLTPLKD